MKKIIVIIFCFCVNPLFAQYTLIPDSNFEGYLVNVGIDTDGIVNGQVLTSDIADETQLALLIGNNITDLTGIEDFESLEVFTITQMDITEINLSQNLNLKNLSISDVSLENLDLSANLNLLSLTFEANYDGSYFYSPLTSIDLSNNLELYRLLLNVTEITEVDLSNNISLVRVLLYSLNELVEVNLKNGFNEEITFLEIYDNPILQCLQVDNPEAVIAGVDPPYDSWFFDNNPNLMITDDCQLGVSDDSLLLHNISLYPNPVSTNLIISNASTFQIETIKIYDALGRLILKEKEQFTQIDVSQLNSGLLFVKIETEQGTVTKKVIKD